MANFYEQSTVEPTALDKELFTEDDLRILESCGFEWEVNEGSYYFFSPESMHEGDDDSRTYDHVFQDVIRRSDGKVEEVVIRGALTCSKMRPGAFGGLVIRITATEVQSGTTGEILDQMRGGRWRK